MPFCIHCGNQNPDVAKFCSSCGQAIASQSSTPDANKPVSPVIETKNPEEQLHAANPVIKPATPVTTEPAPAPVVASTNQTSNSVASPTPATTTNPLFEVPAFWGAFLALLGFFLPWMVNASYIVNSQTLNGLGLAETSMQSSAMDDSAIYEITGIFLAVLLYLTPVSSVIIICDVLFRKKFSRLSRIVRFIPILAFVIFFVLIFIALIEFDAKINYSGFRIGFIISFLGAFAMLYIKKNKL